MSMEDRPPGPTNIRAKVIRDLHLAIEGTRLAPVIDEFCEELRRSGIERVKPHFYLSTEWGVPFGTVSLGIPFYLARPELIAVHAEEVGHIEGFDRADILRYLRHEMGHVVNYAYQLYEDPQWVKLFGSITQPYMDHYRPEPFSTRFVYNLPGWYAQKHPDEDWSETFAVWMTPGHDWRLQYAGWPEALAKLEYCHATMERLRDQDPPVTAIDRDEDAAELAVTVEEFYVSQSPVEFVLPAGLDAALRTMFEDLGEPDPADPGPRLKASLLMARLERPLAANVYRWTGHFPEQTRMLLRCMAARADELEQVYPHQREAEAALALAVLVTSLAATYMHRGSYVA